MSHRPITWRGSVAANLAGIDIIGSITMDFTGVDMSRFPKRNVSSGIEYNLEYQFKIDFRSDEGVLQYSCVSNGKMLGTTSINFTQ